MGDIRISRREILGSIAVVQSGSLLPWRVFAGEPAVRAATAVIRGEVRDAVSGTPVAAKVRVTDAATGEAYMPAHCIRSMPKKTQTGVRYFYVSGAFEVAVPPGRYRIEAVRGISHAPATVEVRAESGNTPVHRFSIVPLRDMHASGWYSGNTHTHYNIDLEEEPSERLRVVPPAEGLDVSVLSYLIRNAMPYPSNRVPIGRLPKFSRDGTLVDMGEECRNNKPTNVHGYGHCLFLNIPRLVEPVSTGMLSPDGKASDFPTLSMLCAEAKKIGGTTVWCHNGMGMETPVAIAMGRVDALNICDGCALDYSWYYRLLNCGVRMPISTGTDWWEYDHNRVFVQVEGRFDYDAWLRGLRAGRTFISNGPLLELSADGKSPGSSIRPRGPVLVRAAAISRVPFERLEIIHDGEVVAERVAADQREARLETELIAKRSGWLAARVAGGSRTARGYPVYAHTGPVYLAAGAPPAERAAAAGAMVAEIERSVAYIRSSYRFASDADRAVAMGHFERGRSFFAKLARPLA